MYSFPDSAVATSLDASIVDDIEWDPVRKRWNTNSSQSEAQMDERREYIVSFIDNVITARGSSFWPTLAEARANLGSYSDEADTKPKKDISFARHKAGISHKNFEARKRAGEILVSDYDRSEVTVRREPGLRGESINYSMVWLSASMLVDLGLLELKDGFLFVKGKPWYLRTSIHSPYIIRVRYSDVTKGRWVFDDPISPEAVISALGKFEYDPTFVVTTALAKANRSSVDVLTAFAEMPETVRSLINGFKLISQMTRDYKQRKFSLSKAYEQRKKRMTAAYHKRLARLDKRLAEDPNLTWSKRQELLDYRSNIVQHHSGAIAQSLVEFNTALAGIWLNYRYNIMPNVYLIEDVMDALDRHGRRFIKASQFEPYTGTITLRGQPVHVEGSIRCVIKRAFSQLMADNSLTVISADLFVTAWEKVPLSFVIDWFVNIGDLLSSMNYKQSWTDSGNTLSSKTTIDVILPVKDTNAVWAIEPVTEVQGFYYRRRAINPSNYCGLVFRPTVGLERKIDALALIWRPVRSSLLEVKR